jgi:mannosylglycoprotein endo-beta-mannosidase
MWAAASVKFGYRWKVGDGTKVRFWEDTWFGTSPLAVQFFDLFVICNEQNKTISQVWDGSTLMLSFRRNFPPILLQQWQELEEIASSITFSDDCDSLIWKYESSGIYSSSCLYAIINFGGVMPIYIPAVWNLIVPPRVHIFLWILSHNKLMTRDNLLKRKMNKPMCCIFCSKDESIVHLLFQ